MVARHRLVAAMIVALALPAAPAAAASGAQEDRIAALEARVRQLEALVERLAAGRPSAPDPPATGDRPGAAAASRPEETLRLEPLLAPAVAQAPVPAPVPAPASAVPQELLPGLGKIGAAASFAAGAHSGPFDLRRGAFLGGSVELPLWSHRGGRVLYEFSAGLGQSESPAVVTSNVAQVANLAVLANVAPERGAANVTAALSGQPPAPYRVSYDVDTRLQLLEVVPFGLKYVATSFDRLRVRPYVAGGLAAFVTISSQRTRPGDGPFAGDLIAGQLAAADDLVRRGLPSGQGALALGFQAGGGVEYRLRPGLSVGVDVRAKRPKDGGAYVTTITRTAFHF